MCCRLRRCNGILRISGHENRGAKRNISKPTESKDDAGKNKRGGGCIKGESDVAFILFCVSSSVTNDGEYKTLEDKREAIPGAVRVVLRQSAQNSPECSVSQSQPPNRQTPPLQSMDEAQSQEGGCRNPYEAHQQTAPHQQCTTIPSSR
jgi:hypothetical protein